MSSVLIIVAAYLWGAIPSAYLVGRLVKGIDIREYGSGNVGASNLSDQLGSFWTGVSLGVFDSVVKGTLVVLAAKLMDQGLAVQAGGGLVAIAGHNWSPYLRFTGGRGVATLIGVMLGFFMWEEMLVGTLLIGILGRLVFRDTGLWTLVSLLVLPVLAYLLEPLQVAYMSAGATALIVLKRLTANWEAPRSEHALPRVLVSRLLWDRDVPRKEQWTGRRPPSEPER